MNFAEALAACPLVASVQASPGSPLGDPSHLRALAEASLGQGVKALRLQGIDACREVGLTLGAPFVGLIKKDYPDSEVYITPTMEEVTALLDLGCPVVALDATVRPRPGGATFADLVAAIRRRGALAMGDCDSPESLEYALSAGCQIVSTTLAGYTKARPATSGPDLDLLRHFVARTREKGVLVLGEGRLQEPWQATAALAMGADGVVIGGALNDPVKQTARFLSASPRGDVVGAVDLGGTWLRFALVSKSLQVLSVERIPTPQTREGRLAWVKERALSSGVSRVGIGAGGTLDPATGEVWEAKDFIPDYKGTVWAIPGLHVTALNDGLATAWGHAHQPVWAGRRVAALALGTGVGAGLVDRGALVCGPRGEYPRWNDFPHPDGGSTIEGALGGLALGREPDREERRRAAEAALWLVKSIGQTWMPEVTVVTGGVGRQEWMKDALAPLPGVTFGPDEAGLIGAACLALYPPF